MLCCLQQSGGEYASHQAQQSTDFFTAGVKATIGTVLEVRALLLMTILPRACSACFRKVSDAVICLRRKQRWLWAWRSH